MRPDLIVVIGIGRKDTAQVGLAPDHNVVQALPTDRADQPLGISVLPRRPWRDRMITNAHRSEPTDNNMTVGSVTVSNEMFRCLIPRESLGNLLGDPLGSRMVGDAHRAIS